MKPALLRRLVLSAVLLAASAVLSGCTFIGMGIGAASDASSNAHQAVAYDRVPAIREGTDVEVYAHPPDSPSDNAYAEKVVEGEFKGVRDDRIILETTDRRCEPSSERCTAIIPRSSVAMVEKKPSTGGWWKGALVGLVIDVTLVVALAAATSRSGGGD